MQAATSVDGMASRWMEQNGLGNVRKRSYAVSSPSRVHGFEFTGTAREYFSIWIVNICLSVLTLGFYYPWAKVRTRRYFYANFLLDDSPFQYTADPRRLLLGHVLVVAYLGSSYLLGETAPLLTFVLMAVAFALLPWMVVGSLAFQRRNSVYRNIRFGFDGTVRKAAGIVIGGGILTALTMGLAFPWLRGVLDQFAVSNTRYGKSRFTFDRKVLPYYAVLVGGAVLYFVLIVPAAILLGVLSSPEAAGGAEALTAGYSLALLAWTYLGYGVVFAVVKAGLTNLLYRNARLGEHRFDSSLRAGRLLWLYVSGAIAIILSMGLLFPWARVRLARYRAESLCLVGNGGLDGFVAGTEPEVRAGGVATEIAEAFAFGFSL